MADSFGPVKRPITPTEMTSEGTPPPDLAKYIRHEMGPDAEKAPEAPALQPSAQQPPVPQAPPMPTPNVQSSVPNVPPGFTTAVDNTLNEKLASMLKAAQEHSHVYKEIRLPSLGRFYDGVKGPSDGILNIREMTGREEEILATPHLVRSGTAMSLIFDQCIKENFKSENLLVADRIYILIWIRAMTYGKIYNTKVTDPHTGQEFSYDIDLNSLSVDYCPEDFGPENLTDILPKSGWTFTYRLPTGADELAIHKRAEQRARDRRGAADSPSAASAHRLALLIDNIDGLEDKMAMETLIRSMHGLDLSKLRSVIEHVPFGVDTKINVFNPHTMNEFVVNLPMGASFFSPVFPTKTE